MKTNGDEEKEEEREKEEDEGKRMNFGWKMVARKGTNLFR